MLGIPLHKMLLWAGLHTFGIEYARRYNRQNQGRKAKTKSVSLDFDVEATRNSYAKDVQPIPAPWDNQCLYHPLFVHRVILAPIFPVP